MEGLKKVLTLWELLSYGIACTVGSGIFVTVGIVAKTQAAGIASFLSALSFAEFASRFPVSGSAYTFAYLSLGEIVGWFVGWNLTLEYAISASAVARGWAGYMASGLRSAGLAIPLWVDNYRINDWISLSPLAVVIVFSCTVLLLIGLKEFARFNMMMTVLNLSIIVVVIGGGFAFTEPSNWSPFFPFGYSGVLRGVGTVFFSYIGFDSVSTLAAEVQRPARDLPIGIIGTLGIATFLYVLVSLAITGMVPYSSLGTEAPISEAFFSSGSPGIGFLVAVGSITTMTATTLVSLVGQPRIFLQMAKDGLILPLFSQVNANGVPFWGTIITGSLSGTIAFFLDLESLTSLISVGTLLAFSVVCAGVVSLRLDSSQKVSVLLCAFFCASILFSFAISYPHSWQPLSISLTILGLLGTFLPLLRTKRIPSRSAFSCPLVPFVPCLGILLNMNFIVALPIDAIVRLIVWTVLGLAIYFFYGIRHSALNKRDDEEEPEIVEESVVELEEMD